jgi:hypothetical protein
LTIGTYISRFFVCWITARMDGLMYVCLLTGINDTYVYTYLLRVGNGVETVLEYFLFAAGLFTSQLNSSNSQIRHLGKSNKFNRIKYKYFNLSFLFLRFLVLLQ